MAMDRYQKYLIFLWQPLTLLALGGLLMLVHFTSPSTDWLFNIVGSVLLLAAAVVLLIKGMRRL